MYHVGILGNCCTHGVGAVGLRNHEKIDIVVITTDPCDKATMVEKTCKVI